MYQKPVVSVEYLADDEPTSYMNPELHLPCCGVLASSITTEAHHTTVADASNHLIPTSPLARSLSDGFLGSRHMNISIVSPPLSPMPTNRSLTPEIFVSKCQERLTQGSNSLTVDGSESLTPLVSQRVRKLSHSSDELDPRDASSGPMLVCKDSGSILRASSATDLQLHLATSKSEGLIQRPPVYSNPVSPLATFQKDGVFGTPLSVLAKGMQSLAPGANKIAKGMQNIGANLDPRKLRTQRQTEADEDPVWKAKKAQCKSVFIEF